MSIETSQHYGYVVLVMILIAVHISRAAFTGDFFFRKQAHPYADSRSGSTVVELSGDTERKGIYYLPPDTRVRRFLEMVEKRKIEGVGTEVLDRILVAGMPLDVRKESPGNWRLTLDGMGNARRLALDMPMALNAVTVDDLMRVDGIGGKTAEMIIETRNEKGGFKSIDDLLEVKGIGMKKHEKFKKYFYIESRR
jgi:competence protein ComEA